MADDDRGLLESGATALAGLQDPEPLGIEELIAQVRIPAGDRLKRQGPLAAGGMGEIEVVIDAALRRRLARKVIHEQLSEDADAVRRFVREARITGRLDHPNIVPIHDVGLAEDGRLFFTMKLVEGRTLEQINAALPEPPLEPEVLLDQLDVIVRVCDALSFAHSRGVLHCDLKPANVMVGEFGQVYLMDWGIARVLDDEVDDVGDAEDGVEAVADDPSDSSKTRNAILGSPAYMAPEQAWGKRQELDQRSDVYAVGALLYDLLARRAPHGGDSFIESLVAAQTVPPEALGDEVPPALARIVMRALSSEPSERHASVRALREELVRFMRGGGDFPMLRVETNEHVVTEGEVGDAAYIIVSGRCDAVRIVDGEEQVLRSMGAGEIFGETAILSAGPRTATVVAREPSVLRVIDQATIERELGGMKPWMGSILRTLAERFRERDSRD